MLLSPVEIMEKKKTCSLCFLYQLLDILSLMGVYFIDVVIYRINKEQIIVADPTKGIVKYKHEEFLSL